MTILRMAFIFFLAEITPAVLAFHISHQFPCSSLVVAQVTNTYRPRREDATRSQSSSWNALTFMTNSDDEATKPDVEIQLEQLQDQLALIEALEERNKAQVESFIDEQDQWDSLEPEEQHLLKSKDKIVTRMELLAEQLVQIWMGQKSMDG